MMIGIHSPTRAWAPEGSGYPIYRPNHGPLTRMLVAVVVCTTADTGNLAWIKVFYTLETMAFQDTTVPLSR